MNVNENSKSVLTIQPINEAGNSFVPGSVRYRVDDKSTLTPIIAWTSVTTLATVMTIEIHAKDNNILDSNNTFEDRVVTVETDELTVDAHVEEFEYRVKNLSFVS